MPQLSDAPTQANARRFTPIKGLLVLGPFLCATFGGPLLADWLREIPLGTVSECSVHNAHGPAARVVLKEGPVISLRTKDLAYPERCIPAGTSLEKRRYELAYRFNGRPQVAGDPTHLVAVLTSGLGVAMVAAGVVMALARRRRRTVEGRTEKR